MLINLICHIIISLSLSLSLSLSQLVSVHISKQENNHLFSVYQYLLGKKKGKKINNKRQKQSKWDPSFVRTLVNCVRQIGEGTVVSLGNKKWGKITGKRIPKDGLSSSGVRPMLGSVLLPQSPMPPPLLFPT